MTRKRIRLQVARFWQGATPQAVVSLLLPDLAAEFEFSFDGEPQVVLYGPYPGSLPPGRYVRVFIGCENIVPLMAECDWAFGMWHENLVPGGRYMRIARWGDDRPFLQRDADWEAVLRDKTRFCAFVFSNPTPYREAFFRALSRYRHVDAPGRSMNNMASIDPVPGHADWDAKIAFLRQYKFVVAFENASRPGYNTEKLQHPLQADCVPIYWGDPRIGSYYNVRRFINAHDYVPSQARLLPRLPYFPHTIARAGWRGWAGRAANRWNGEGERLEQRLLAARGFGDLVERVVQLDRDDALYLAHLREPNLPGNRPPDRSAWIDRWRRIFREACA